MTGKLQLNWLFASLVLTIYCVPILAHNHADPNQNEHYKSDMVDSVVVETTKVVADTGPQNFLSSGWEMWNFYSCEYTDGLLKDTSFRYLVSQLNLGTIRVGGITCDFTNYSVTSSHVLQIKNKKQKNNVMGFWPDYNLVLGISHFESLLEFAKATNAQLVFGLNELDGRDCHSDGETCHGNWNTANVEMFLQYIHDNNVGPIVAFELGNELTKGKHLTMQEQIADYRVLSQIMTKIFSDKPVQNRPKLFGPSTDICDGDSLNFIQSLAGTVDTFTYHSYPANDGANLTRQLIDIQWLKNNLIQHDPHANSIMCIQYWQQYGKPKGMNLWVTETSSSYNSVVGVMNTFMHGFWYLASLGQYALTGVTAHCKWELVNDGAFSFMTFSGKSVSVIPDFWIAVIFNRVVGRKVLQVNSAPNNLFVYAFCGKSGVGSVTLVFGNPNTQSTTLSVSFTATPKATSYELYSLTADSLNSPTLKLNGVPLELASGKVPPLNPVTGSGDIPIAAYSYGFVVFPNAGVQIC